MNYIPMTTKDGILGIFGRGKFPGSIPSWGTSKISLNSEDKNNLSQRDGFTIHGGWFSGSRGCIDLTKDNDNFMQTFLTIGKDLPLEVQYYTPPK